ncbi:hypothetical protein BBJ29_009935 [Phytophthora kernoviae]|uniref:GAF domain-containing protein n=1 Tax=Phytophthora kernoviae TaxID=325452 RepID=A0A3F2RCE3_9STRA|nr:hypothetical protein BBJ29_009935 [Phytophthora kernoviae]RLN51139.1 hypothetical protein BBP00_00009964 [Phytophthora kernoviae]
MGRSIRLHLGKKSESAPSYWNDGEPPAPPLQLSIALHGLMAEAEALHDRVDFAGFVDLVESPRIPFPCDGQQQWKRTERSATFSLLKRADEVLAFALLDATVEEVASILCSTAEKTYSASMNGLYRDTFISGSIPYVQRSHNSEEDGMHQQLAVKTSNFVRPDVLSKNEQWCFAELFRRKPQDDSFTLVQGSLSAEQARLRIVFHAIYKPDSLNGGDSEGEKSTPIVPRKAVMSRMLRLAQDQEKTQAQADVNANLLSTAINYPQQADAVKRALDTSNCPADPAACEVASAESRPYPMMPALVDLKSDSHEPAEPIIYPIPANEEIRLAAIEHFKLHDVVNIPELNVICTLAAAEMNCPHSVVTLVEREVVTLMATNAPENWDVGSGNPREQTFCQHFVMDDRPLLVSHAEADMRFYHIAPVVMRSLRFYAGFPISVTSVRKTGNPGEPEKVIVGSLCCLDAKPHQMTRSQYWRLMKLAEAASAILEKQAEEFLVSPNKFASNLAGTGTSKGTTAVAC